MEDYEALENIKKLSQKIGHIQVQANRQNRNMNADELSVIAEMEGHIDELKKWLPQKPQTVPLNATLGGSPSPTTISTSSRKDTRPYQLRGPREAKDHRSLFGSDGYQWPDKDSNFFDAVFSGRYHPGLIKNGMTETVPSDGGFLVPVEYSSRIHNVSLENEIVMPNCFVQPMTSNECKIPGMVIGDHSSNLFGGFTASYTSETGTISENNPKVRGMTLNAKKLTGLIRFSSELQQDIPGGENQIINICGKGLGFYRDKAYLKGTGAGEPLGILNADCTIEVDPEGGQAADSIQYANLTKMVGRLHPGCFNNSVWIIQVSAIPKLLELSVVVGTGGSHVPVLSESDGVWKILTRPVIFTEKTEKLGDRGDVILADLSQYVVGLRSEMRFDMSIHAHFTTDELLARLIERHDGQPLWDQPLTLEDGSTTVSPFVVLGAR